MAITKALISSRNDKGCFPSALELSLLSNHSVPVFASSICFQFQISPVIFFLNVMCDLILNIYSNSIIE